MNRKETRKLQRKYCDNLLKHIDNAEKVLPSLKIIAQNRLRNFMDTLSFFENHIRKMNHHDFYKLYQSYSLPDSYLTNIDRQYRVDVDRLIDRFNERVAKLSIVFKRDAFIDDILDET